MSRKLISIITPCYNEELNIEACYIAVKAVFENQLKNYDYEHVFCDNASSDSTVEKLEKLAKNDSNVKVIVNARNYGPFRSTFNALLSTKGDAVVVMLAADLQDPPEVVVDFVKEWENGNKVVYGIRANREESFIMRNIRKLYYRILSSWANIQIPVDAGEFQLVDRVVIDALKQHDDHYPYIRGMIANCGFKAKGVPYTWKARERGFSKNRLYHLIDQGLNGLISFTNLPMRLCMFFGFIVATLSILYAITAMLINFVYFREFSQPGIATLIVGLFFFGGVQLFVLGVVGEYVSAIHQQVRKKPLVVEQKRINI